MAKTSYQNQKRQKEMSRKRKKEEKKLRKLERNGGPPKSGPDLFRSPGGNA